MTTDSNDRDSLKQDNNIILIPKRRTLRKTALEKKANYIFKRKYERINKPKRHSDNKNNSDKSRQNGEQLPNCTVQQVNRGNKLPRIKVIFSTANWFLPRDIQEANLLNDKVTFYYQNDSSSSIAAIYNIENNNKNYNDNWDEKLSKQTFANNIKIKYDPKKFLNFNKSLNTSQKEYLIETDTEQTHQDVDFDLETFLNKNVSSQLDSLEIPYKSIYPLKKKNYFHATPLTIPTKEDRILFHRLFVQSKGSSFLNSNITMTFPQDSKELLALKKPYKASNVKYIYINNHEIKTLYPSPYPENINKQSIIYICQLCLQYSSNRFQYNRHKLKCSQCNLRRPLGNEIYRDKSISIFEIDGREHKTFAKNLCLLSMLFLKSKTLYYEVEPFMFYVLYEHPKLSNDSAKNSNTNNNDEGEMKLVGYFSKEKLNSTNYNLSCILTLPTHRRLGYGFLLMDFSYLLSKREFKHGTPEKPLSDLGLITYRTFWKIKCLETLLYLRDTTKVKTITLEDLSNILGMAPTDIILGLEQLRVLFYSDREDGTRQYAIIINNWKPLEDMYRRWKAKNPLTIKPEKLLWKPMIFGPSCGMNAVNTNLTDSFVGIDNNIEKFSGIDSDEDIFNKHIDLITSFMKDDIDNNYSTIESETLNKLNANDICIDSIGNMQEMDWKLCFREPRLHGNTLNKLNNKFRLKKKVSNLDQLGKKNKMASYDENDDYEDKDISKIFNNMEDINIDNYDDDHDDDYSEVLDQEEDDLPDVDSDNSVVNEVKSLLED